MSDHTADNSYKGPSRWMMPITTLRERVFALLGTLIFFAGMAANLNVESLNGGMPFRAPYAVADPTPLFEGGRTFVPITEHTKLAFLGDIIHIPPWGWFSVGDFLLLAGMALMCVGVGLLIDRYAKSWR